MPSTTDPTPAPTSSDSAPSPAPSTSTSTSDSQLGGGGGWFEGVKKAAVEQYNHLKAKDRSAIHKMDEVMAKLEADYQAEKKIAHNEWLSLKNEDEEMAAEIRKAMQASQEQIAQAKKSAIASMRQAIDVSRTKIQAKTEAEYTAAKSSARDNYDALKDADMQMAAKVEAGITEAETKLGIAKQSCIAQYGKVLADAATELALAQKEAAEEYAKATKDAGAVVDAAKATESKTVNAVKARSEADAAAAKAQVGTIQSDMEKQMAAVKVKVLAECDKLQTLNASKAEEIEKKLRDAESKVAMAKKAADDDYHKMLKEVTDNLHKLSASESPKIASESPK